MPTKVPERRIMSVFKQKNAIASTEFKSFEGIDVTAPHGYVPAAGDMVNFRVTKDGSLEKRSGFAPVAICEKKIRAIWSGKLEGVQSTFIVSGNVVSSVDPTEHTLVTLGYIANPDGHANFILFNSRLYLMDGIYIYGVSNTGVRTVEGYAPLYGKNWGSAKKGPVNEPLNLATRHIRMTYRLNETLTYLCVDHVISSIDAVYINGSLASQENNSYYFDEELMCVCVMGIKVGDYVELFLTVAESEMDRAALFSCKSSVVYGTYTDNRLFLWDGDSEDIMFASRSVNGDELQKSQSFYPNTVPLYIPEDAAFTMTKDGRRITAVCRHYDRLLIFTNADTWMAKSSESGNPLDAVTINPSQGCTSDGAVVMCGNDPICVSDGNILCWTSDTDELSESNAYSISKKINPHLTPSFFKNAKLLFDDSLSELYFIDPYDEQGIMWIYNYDTKNWFKFDGIYADSLFLCDKTLGFVRDNAVYLFNDTKGYDVMADGSERKIVAFYESLPTDLSVAGNKKRLCGMTLNACLFGGEICAEYISEGKTISTKKLQSDSLYPTSIIKRLNSNRFCYLTLRLTCDDGKKQKIYSTSVWAKH